MIQYTEEEIQYIRDNYATKGPKVIASKLNRAAVHIGKKARSLGLTRTISASNRARRNKWEFTSWSYDLGYIAGVYLGDGNVWIDEGHTAYFRHGSIDEDFIQAVQKKIYLVTGHQARYIYHQQKQQFILTFANKDFTRWLVTQFGPAFHKKIKVLPDMEANKGMLEGIMDSEGTVQKYTLTIRMCADLEPLDTICILLGVKHGGRFIGIREQLWSPPDRTGQPLCSYSISNKEWTRLGLGTYIKRKCLEGMLLKT